MGSDTLLSIPETTTPLSVGGSVVIQMFIVIATILIEN
jgi:hypothetical protein